MLRLNVLPLLRAQGKTKYWLYKQLGMSYQNFNRMVNNQTNHSIRGHRDALPGSGVYAKRFVYFGLAA